MPESIDRFARCYRLMDKEEEALSILRTCMQGLLENVHFFRNAPQEESVDQLLANLGVSLKKIDDRKKELQEKEERWKLLEQKMDENLAKVSQKITLDVGGKKYTTSKDTLMSIPGTYFTGLLGSGRWKPEADGSYFIDRDRKLFHYVLQLLRTGEMSLDTLSEKQKKDLKRELEYYLIPWNSSSAQPSIQLDTSDILSAQYTTKIEEWLGGGKKMGERLYKATEHGFKALVFHRLCDGKGPTVVVVQSDNDSLFGGYAQYSWSSAGAYITSTESFLFALKNPQHNCSPQAQGSGITTLLPVPLLVVGMISKYVMDRGWLLHRLALVCTYEDMTGKGNALFTGARNFQTKEIEVYRVI
ncbi:hypothetical protein PROFUN_01982 [Planoprotostelium fungivorum]|uniref:Uncharacterized protein n=1 Tax=Planoprotostelium fungivorum TaxID=1890364 RepID=A0A2P6NB22_9EUKA|nr:hypothetical protein PROFUN_01982 [Planoprotostelium fungivorum]